mgnify:CR=1 FL=1
MSPLPTRAPRLLPVAAAILALAAALPSAQASSHREAPSITATPKVDATDFYMFSSYEPGRSGYVTLIANYQPLQDPYGGPNYFQLDPNALYEIHVDNNGDAKEDLSFQFRFKNTFKGITLPISGKNVGIPLIQAGGVAAPNAAALNVNESFTLDVVRGDRRSGDAGNEEFLDHGCPSEIAECFFEANPTGCEHSKSRPGVAVFWVCRGSQYARNESIAGSVEGVTAPILVRGRSAP